MVDEVSVAIIDVATGEVVYSEGYIDFEQAVVDVSMLDPGEYRLQLTVDNTIYLGNFAINN